MKKILFMAVIAVAFMACGEKNGANLPSKDKKAMDKVTVQAIEMIGQSAASVEKALLNAGFVKTNIDPMGDPMGAPKRMKHKFQAPAASSTTEVMYVYGVDPEKFSDEDEDANVAAFNSALKKGSIIVAYAVFAGDKLYGIECIAVAKCAKGASSMYTNISDGMFAEIPSDALMSKWEGAIAKKSYTKQNEFVAAIAAAEDGITAQEQGYAVTAAVGSAYEGFVYVGQWADPDAATKAEMEKDGYLPYVTAIFAVFDINAAMQQ